MANVRQITQRIALEGGEAILEALKALGAAGEKAFEQIRTAAEGVTKAKPLENLALTAEILKERLDALGEAGRRVATAGVAFGRAWRGLESNLRRVTRNITLLVGAITAAGAAVVAFVKTGADAADETSRQAELLGLTIEAYQGLKFAATQADVGTSAFETGMKRLSVVLGRSVEDMEEVADAGFGTLNGRAEELGISVVRGAEGLEALREAGGNAQGTLAKLGISLRDANGEVKSLEDLVLELADAFAAMPNGIQENALAFQLFGKSFGDFLPFLNQGSAAIRAAREELIRFGLATTEADAQIGDRLGKSFGRLGTILDKLRIKLATAFAPVVTEISDAFAQLVLENARALQELARGVADTVLPVVKDVLNALTGRDSEVVDQRILEWREAILSFGRGVQEVVTTIVIPAFNALLGIFDGIADALNGVFGTEFTGGALLAAAVVAEFLGVFKLLGSAVAVVFRGFQLLGATIGFALRLLPVLSGFFSLLVEGAIAFGIAVAGLVGWPALIVVGIAAALTAIVVFWDDIAAAGERASQQAHEQAQAVVDAVGTAITAAGEAGERASKNAQDQAKSIVDGLGSLWNGIVEAAETAWGAVAAATQTGIDAVGTILSGIGNVAGGAFAGITTAAQFVMDGLAGIFQAGAATVVAIWQGLSGAVTDVFNAAAATIQQAAQAIGDALTAATTTAADSEGIARIAEAISAPFIAARDVIASVFDSIGALVQQGFDAAVSAGDSAIEGIGRVAREITTRLRRELEQMTAALNAALSRILAAIARAVSRLRAAAAEARAAGGDSGEGFARGGFVRGPGTDTSDSIPAMLSRGEFVVNARAVRKLGLAFMRAVNAGRVAAKQVGGIAHFRDGGLVGGLANVDLGGIVRSLAEGIIPAPQLALAGLGQITEQRQGRAVNLYLPGVDQPLKVTTEEDVFGRLSSFISKAGMRQAGRPPGWR